jgi:predicted dinucleotide-binding enzyme
MLQSKGLAPVDLGSLAAGSRIQQGGPLGGSRPASRQLNRCLGTVGSAR